MQLFKDKFLILLVTAQDLILSMKQDARIVAKMLIADTSNLLEDPEKIDVNHIKENKTDANK